MTARVIEDVSPDEKCYGLTETNRLVNGQWRRVQTVFVARDGELCQYTRDVGDAWLLEEANLQAIYAVGEDSVGTLMEEAERTRWDDYEKKLRQEVLEASTLIPDFLQEKEENWERIKNRSQFGPSYSKQRNGFPWALRERGHA